MTTIALHKYQTKAFQCQKKIITLSAGIQSGKTTFGTVWMAHKLFKYTDPLNNFLIIAPTFKILQQATLPSFFQMCKDYGSWYSSKAEFKVHGGGTIYMRTATDPESIEGVTNVRAIWCDEAGRFSKYFWDNVEGRAAIKQAQILNTTTPYALNWLKQMHDDWKLGKRDDVEFINFRSIDNPYFPREEYERQRRLLDPRRFAMKYDGVFGEMVGLVYEQVHSVKAFDLPQGTRYYAGVDWGYHDPFVIHTRAVTPQGIHYQVDEFGKSGLLLSDMIQAMIQRHHIYKYELVFCDPSRPEYIKEFNAHGIKAVGAINDITLGIDRHRELMRTDRFYVFQDRCPATLKEYSEYHYPEPEEVGIDDDSGEPIPVDANNHHLDATRYTTMGLYNMIKQPVKYIETLRTPKRPNYERIS